MDSSHPDWRVMVPHCGFDLHFFYLWVDIWSLFSSSWKRNVTYHPIVVLYISLFKMLHASCSAHSLPSSWMSNLTENHGLWCGRYQGGEAWGIRKWLEFFTRGLEGERESSVTSGKASLDEVLFWKEIEKRGCFRHTIKSQWGDALCWSSLAKLRKKGGKACVSLAWNEFYWKHLDSGLHISEECEKKMEEVTSSGFVAF